jgi:hypothetical protein
MKRERFSFFVLFVEIAAIVVLHSAKSQQSLAAKPVLNKKAIASAPYQLKALSFTKIKQ